MEWIKHHRKQRVAEVWKDFTNDLKIGIFFKIIFSDITTFWHLTNNKSNEWMIMCTRVLEHETTFLFLFCYNIIDDSLSSFVNHLLLYFFWTQIFTWQRNSILKVETSHHLSEFWFYDMPFSHYNALIGTSGVLKLGFILGN